jgi:uncharacterized protein (TIGR02466 family)
MPILQAFPTSIYQSRILPPAKTKALNRGLLAEIEDLSSLDEAGAKWSKRNYRNGFTSYASANELQRFFPTFADLEKQIDTHVKKFAKALDFDLGGRPLRMTNCWANVMESNTHHGMHLHPLSVISGTYYVKVPKGSSCLKFEDPRLSLFMGSPPRKERCSPANRVFVDVPAQEGNLVLFESWLRHEVPIQAPKEARVSVSFNYGWGD